MADHPNGPSRLAGANGSYSLPVLGEVSPRLLLGVGILVSLLAVNEILKAGDRISSLRAERISLEQRLTQYGDGLDLDEWTARADAAATVTAGWQALSWTGPTAGVIDAQIQSRLTAIGSEATLDNVRIDVDPDVISIETGRYLRFQFSTRNSDFPSVLAGLEKIAGATPALLAKDINLSLQRDQSVTMTLSGLAPVTIEAPAPANSAGEQGE